MNTFIFNYPPHGNTIAYELHKTQSNKPCIIGNAREKMSSKDKFFAVVFRPSGGRTKYHPLPVRDLCLYEVHIGDVISISEVIDDILYMNAFIITEITDTKIIAVHGII